MKVLTIASLIIGLATVGLMIRHHRRMKAELRRVEKKVDKD